MGSISQIGSSKLRRIAEWGAAGLVSAVVFGVIGQFAIALATEWGWYDDIDSKWWWAVSGLFNFLTSPITTHFALAIVGIALGLWADVMLRKKEQVVAEDTDLTLIEGKTFRNEKIILDGHHYRGCKFFNVTFAYGGGPLNLERNEIAGVAFETTTVETERVMLLFHQLGFLDIPVHDEFGEVSINSRFPDEKQ